MFLTGSRSVTGTVVQSGLFSVPFRAYALTKDGGYQDVTGQATWTGTPTLVPTSSPGMFNSTGAGTGRATARYLGVEASLAMEVVPSGRTIFPTLSMIDPGVLKLGDRVQLTAVFQPTQTAFIQTAVVDGVTWTSQDSRILAITGRVADCVGIGTTVLTVEYSGVTTRFYFSVLPR